MLKCSSNCPIKELPFVSTAQRTKAATQRLVTTKEFTQRPLPVCFLAFLCHHQAVVSAFIPISIFFTLVDGLVPPAPPNQHPQTGLVKIDRPSCLPPEPLSCHGGLNGVVLLLEHFWMCVFGDAVAVYWGVTGAQARMVSCRPVEQAAQSQGGAAVRAPVSNLNMAAICLNWRFHILCYIYAL